jgi:hypothetical protein
VLFIEATPIAGAMTTRTVVKLLAVVAVLALALLRLPRAMSPYACHSSCLALPLSAARCPLPAAVTAADKDVAKLAALSVTTNDLAARTVVVLERTQGFNQQKILAYRSPCRPHPDAHRSTRIRTSNHRLAVAAAAHHRRTAQTAKRVLKLLHGRKSIIDRPNRTASQHERWQSRPQRGSACQTGRWLAIFLSILLRVRFKQASARQTTCRMMRVPKC